MTVPPGHSGRWIVDADGRVLTLHGVNMVNKLPPYHPAAIGFGEDDAAFLRAEGFNTVRLGIIYKALEPEPGRFDDAYLERIAETVGVLSRQGILVLVDFHQDQYNERFNGEGFPDWAVQDDGLRARPDLGFPGNYIVMRALWRAYDHFWANDPASDGIGLQDHYAAAWRRVAARFREEPLVLGYDIFNEPFPGSSWLRCARPGGCPAFDRDRLTGFSRRVFAAIREIDERRLCFYEPNVHFDFGAATHHGCTGDPLAGFTFHNYCLAAAPAMPHLPGRFQDVICEKEEQRVFDNAERQSQRTGDALLLSEFGATDDLRSIGRVVDVADRNMVSWQYWAYFNEDVCCERPDEGIIIDARRPPSPGNVKQGKLDVLVRPYPQAVAGTPARFGFSRESKTFELLYSTARAGGGTLESGLSTEVLVPERQYPRGYRLTVDGAQAVSDPNDRVLRLVAEPEAKQVSVRVAPR